MELEKTPTPSLLSEYYPYVRWWWFGNDLNSSEIEREMRLMKEQKIGGVEIQSIYAAKNSSSNNQKIVPWLSDEWLSCVKTACSVGKELDLAVDMTFGNGWPFGGPHIPKRLASSKLQSKKRFAFLLTLKTKSLSLKSLDITPENFVGAVAIPLFSSKKHLIQAQFSELNNSIQFKLSSGFWEINIYFNGKTKQKVKRAAPAGDGWVMDHLSQEAFDVHAAFLGGKLTETFGDDLGSQFGAFFCDSWEVYKENWTALFAQEFQQQKGYDIVPYLPFLGLDKFLKRPKLGVPKNLSLVKYDYAEVHANLILQNFFGYFAQYCHQHSVECRVQPYVAPVDLLKAYSLLDCLEIEGFGSHGIGSKYYGKFDPRLASSAAHIYGKKLVSCESFTWLGEHFSVSLEDLKKEADQILLHGITRIIYHGFPYSSPDHGVPGQVFYASIMNNPNQTWWGYSHLLNEYIARNAYLSRNTYNRADFAVYLPIHDEWMGKEKIILNLRTDLRKNGHFTDFDYINDESLFRAEFKDRELCVGTARYYYLIVWHTEYTQFSVLQKILDFIKQGLMVFFISELPDKVPGNNPTENDQAKMVALANEIRSLTSSQYVRILSNLEEINISSLVKTIIPDVLVREITASSDLKKPLTVENLTHEGFVIPGHPLSPIQLLHQFAEGIDYYLLVNSCGSDFQGEFLFRNVGSAEIWDLMHLTRLDLDSSEFKEMVVETQTLAQSICLNFQPFESKWIVFKHTAEDPIVYSSVRAWLDSETEFNSSRIKSLDFIHRSNMINSINLNSGWQLDISIPDNLFPKVAGKSVVRAGMDLIDWKDDPELQYFSGSAKYTLELSVDLQTLHQVDYVILNLGKCYDIADISINGQKLEIIWWGSRQISLSKDLLKSENHLEITITNLLLNQIIGYEKNGIRWKSDYYFVNQNYRKFLPKLMAKLPSGLIGPVSLQFYTFPNEE